MKATITPSVLEWARISSGYSISDVVEKLKVKTVTDEIFREWETGKSYPTYPQLKRLADFYKRPVAIFFFPEPPEEDPVEKDFRGVLPKQNAQGISPEMRHLIRKAKVRQIELEELHFGIKNYPEITYLKPTQNDPVKLAQKIREKINISIEEQKNFDNADVALKEWRKKVEQLGVWVFKDSFGTENNQYCGFCIYDQYFPVIYINNNHPKERQIFTLFHELAHLLSGKTGIDFRATPIELAQAPYQQEEVFCNAFAGEFLMPESIFRTCESLPNDDELIKMAHNYKVSYDVILRKFLDLNFITSEGYNNKIEERRIYFSNKTNHQKSSGGDYYGTRKAYLGEKYLELAFNQYHTQRIDQKQLVEYLGVKVSTIAGLENLL